MAIIVGKQGMQPFPITNQHVSRKHLKLTPLEDGNVLVEDLNSANGTFIDGVRILKKTVSPDTIVRMGSSFTFRVSDALGPAGPQTQGPTPQNPELTPVKTASINHLQDVWKKYEEELDALDSKNKSIALWTRVSSVFTIGGGVIGGVLRSMNGLETLSNISLVASGLGLIIMIYSIVQQASFDYKKEKKRLDESFESKYVCPDCHKFLGYRKFSLLIQQVTQCPYCRIKFKN